MLTIHGVPISVHTRKVIVAAMEKKVPHSNDPVIPFHPPAGWEDSHPGSPGSRQALRRSPHR